MAMELSVEKYKESHDKIK